MKSEDFVLIAVMGLLLKLQTSKGKAGKGGKADPPPKLSKEEIERLEKWIDTCPDIRRLDGKVYISLSAFKYMLRWSDTDLKSDTFLDVLSAVNKVYDMFPIKTFLVEEMDPELIKKLKQSGIKI